jgi:hypothetical protein
MNRSNEPNEYGFVGGATAPQPAADEHDDHAENDDQAEEVAVPADDLTTGILGDEGETPTGETKADE